VRLGHADGPHLVHKNRHAGTGCLPSGLAAGEAAADDVDGLGHGGECYEKMSAVSIEYAGICRAVEKVRLQGIGEVAGGAEGEGKA
jgi:hypothetical protein